VGLRTQILTGGLYMALRSCLGFLLGAIGAILVTRKIGPAAYGLYAATFGIFLYLSQLGQMGINVYLIRKEGEIEDHLYHQAFCLLLLLGIAISTVAILSLPLLQRIVRLAGFKTVGLVFFCGLPLSLLAMIPLARLERNLDYRRVATIELVQQVVYLIVAVSLAYKGFGVWAPVSGFWAGQVVVLIVLYWVSRYWPRFFWNWQLVREMTGYGLGYSSSTWVWQLRTLVNPVLVSRFMGAEAVGYIAVAINLVNMMSFVKTATWRISIAALGKLQESRNLLAQAVSEGMQLQVMALGPFLVVLLCLAPWGIPLVYGPHWLPVLTVLPFIATGSLINAMFNLHASTLYVLRLNWKVTKFHIVAVVLFMGGAVLLVSRFGLRGYGLAELLVLPSYLLLHKYLRQTVGTIKYQKAFLWCLPFAVALYSYMFGWWVMVGLVGLLMMRSTWVDLLKLKKSFQTG
jgi:O-antigen/teichoic acid export membrane protein